MKHAELNCNLYDYLATRLVGAGLGGFLFKLHNYVALVVQFALELMCGVAQVRLPSGSTSANGFGGSFVVCATFVSTLFGYSTLRMCHCVEIGCGVRRLC